MGYNRYNNFLTSLTAIVLYFYGMNILQYGYVYS